MKLEYTNNKIGAIFSISNFDVYLNKSESFDDENFKIIWVKDGSFSIEIDSVNYKFVQNQLFFLTPLNKTRLVINPENALSFSFNREFYCIHDHDKEVSCVGYLFYGSSEIPIISLDEKEVESFELLLMVLKEEFEDRDHIQGEMLQVLLKRLIIKSTRLSRQILKTQDIQQNKLDIIRQFNVKVEQNFKLMHKVSDYANILNKSPKTLSNLFAQYNNKTPLQVIQDRIILEAKRLCIFTEKTAKEIAFEIGFEDPAHFSRFFKNITGENTTEFRKSRIGHHREKLIS